MAFSNAYLRGLLRNIRPDSGHEVFNLHRITCLRQLVPMIISTEVFEPDFSNKLENCK